MWEMHPVRAAACSTPIQWRLAFSWPGSLPTPTLKQRWTRADRESNEDAMRLLAVCVLAARTQARVALVAAPCIRLGSTPVRGPRAWQELSGRAFGWRVSFVPHIERSCFTCQPNGRWRDLQPPHLYLSHLEGRTRLAMLGSFENHLEDQ